MFTPQEVAEFVALIHDNNAIHRPMNWSETIKKMPYLQAHQDLGLIKLEEEEEGAVSTETTTTTLYPPPCVPEDMSGLPSKEALQAIQDEMDHFYEVFSYAGMQFRYNGPVLPQHLHQVTILRQLSGVTFSNSTRSGTP